MENKDNKHRMSFQGKDVFIDGVKVFTVPFERTEAGINLIGFSRKEKKIYVGSGRCCYGPISILRYEDEGDGEKVGIQVDTFRIPAFNVYDIIPINETYILATGYGCSGAGVGLVDTYNPKITELVSDEEYTALEEALRKKTGLVKSWDLRYGDPFHPRLHVDALNETVTLEVGTGTHYPRQQESKDLGHILRERGFDMKKIMEINEGYQRGGSISWS
jgi:hypothetical protein